MLLHHHVRTDQGATCIEIYLHISVSVHITAGAGARARARDSTRVDATWNDVNIGREGTHTGPTHRGSPRTEGRPSQQGTDPHKGPTHTEDTQTPLTQPSPCPSAPHRGAPHTKGPTHTRGRPTQDTLTARHRRCFVHGHSRRDS